MRFQWVALIALVGLVAGTATADDGADAQALATCIRFQQPSTCFMSADAQACLNACVSQLGAAQREQAQQGLDGCLSNYVLTDGRSPPYACAMPGALAPRPGETVATLGAALTDAINRHDMAAVDAAYAKALGVDAFNMREGCTKVCRSDGPGILATVHQGPALVTAYKRCMVAADSTAEARKLEAYERDLYCDYLAKASTRCRAPSKCDTLEARSSFQCTYASPGLAGACGS
jgi:hypothetical protein